MRAIREFTCIILFLLTLSDARLLAVIPVNGISGQDFYSENLKGYRFTVAWITDTQYYSESHPEIFKKVVEWINNEADNGRIHYVVHTGDLVNDWWDMEQWRNFMSSWSNLTVAKDALAGNHDFSGQNDSPFDSNIQSGRYYTRSKEGYLFIFLSFASIQNSQTQRWLRETAQNSESKIVVLTHAYINSRGSLYDDGKIIEGILSESYPGVSAVWCGHSHVERIVYRTDDGVLGILHDFQGYKNGGNGYLVLIDMYDNGFYMRLHSVLEGFDGRGKGEGYELTANLYPKSRQLYQELRNRVYEDLTRATQRTYLSIAARNLIEQASSSYLEAISFEEQLKWQEAYEALQRVSRLLEMADQEEQTFRTVVALGGVAVASITAIAIYRRHRRPLPRRYQTIARHLHCCL